MSDPFIGQITLAGFNFPPMGWALCDGSALPIVQYQALFAVIGIMYGGDGQTNFCLPDLRGKVAIGYSDSIEIGTTGGTNQVALTASQSPQHNHTLQCLAVAPATPGNNPAAGLPSATNVRQYIPAAGQPLVSLNQGMVQPIGNTAPHDNRQPYLALNYMIAVEGIFPVRP